MRPLLDPIQCQDREIAWCPHLLVVGLDSLGCYPSTHQEVSTTLNPLLRHSAGGENPSKISFKIVLQIVSFLFVLFEIVFCHLSAQKNCVKTQACHLKLFNNS